MSNSIEIYDYFDYRSYISDAYHALKSSRLNFSFRIFAKEVGVASHSYITRILNRERNLSENYVEDFARVLKLNELGTQYLLTLVRFNNSKSGATKEQYLRTLLSIRYRRGETYRLTDNLLKFYQKWYYPIVRELVTLVDFQDDYSKLSKASYPKITTAQAMEAVKYLLENNFIQKDITGKYKLVDYFITSTESEVTATIVKEYHKKSMELIVSDIDKLESTERDLSSLVMRVNHKTYNDIKREISDFRKRLLAMARESEDPDMVYFFGAQLVPRSKPVSSTSKEGTENE